MTVRRPKFPRTDPRYQGDFEDAVGPAFKSLIIVAASAGWATATVAEGLLALARAQVLEVFAGIASAKQLRIDLSVRTGPDELPTPKSH
jgi:hypothetical protein